VFNGRVSPVFDAARRIRIVEIDDGTEVLRTEHSVGDMLPWQRVKLLGEQGVTHLICGAISMPVMNLLMAHGIKVTPNIAGYVDEVLRAYASSRLLSPQFMMPGSWGPGQRGRYRHGRNWRGM
jgi:predicted Fe-Mo cluster-binding NifX family protein